MPKQAIGKSNQLLRSTSDADGAPPLRTAVISQALKQLSDVVPDDRKLPAIGPDRRQEFSADERQARQVGELVDFTQHILRNSHRARDARFAKLDRSDLNKCVESIGPLREQVYAELIGKLPDPTMDPNPRTRLILEDVDYTGYEVMLDVYPDVIAAGILLLPNDLQPDEKRPVVVCQHGLEGTPMDTISGPESPGYRAYKSFSAELVKRGFIVYAPQNPYRGHDAFRTLQRKSNPLGRSLFSYIIPQHLVTLRWLSSLPNVDKDRIGFYGLSYGGKTAVRVPPLLPPTADEPGYCLSICSADYNEWVSKNASIDAPFSYIWTGEYEIFEWNMGHVANYAELSMLMTPRPFMVERGHDDGVGIDEWVAWEYAKVRRHYNKLGIGDQDRNRILQWPSHDQRQRNLRLSASTPGVAKVAVISGGTNNLVHMRTDNPYQPPQTESTLIEPETPEIFVDGIHLVVASGVELPQRCVKTNEPVTDQDCIEETLQWRGRTLELMINVPECELRWYAARRVRWRGRAAMMMGMVLLVGGTLVLFFGLENGWIQDPLSFAAVGGIVMIGAFMLFKAQHVPPGLA